MSSQKPPTQISTQTKIILYLSDLCLGLFFLFLTLKLAGGNVGASWSWIWVTSPLWVWLAFLPTLFVLCLALDALVLTVQGIYNLFSGQTYSGPVGSKGSWRDFFG